MGLYEVIVSSANSQKKPFEGLKYFYLRGILSDVTNQMNVVYTTSGEQSEWI